MKIRKANINDLDLYFEWANDDVTRANSINPEKIKYENHVKWFKNKINDNDSFLYIVSENDNHIGQIRFELKDDGYYHIDYSVDVKMRGMGYGKKILELAMNELKNDIPGKAILIALILEYNLPSLKTFRGYGFKEVGSVDINHRKYIKLIFEI
ncbi:MAG TPA: GNAT family N-acetyltransferase [Ignavibacteria bacterium]|nr:GNAT family N-acetyltransferase [Ignavibacteria bacterium]